MDYELVAASTASMLDAEFEEPEGMLLGQGQDEASGDEGRSVSRPKCSAHRGDLLTVGAGGGGPLHPRP